MANMNNKKFFNNFMTEFRKITWPTKQQVIRKTIVVLIVSIILGLIVFGFDTIYQIIMRIIMQKNI